MALRILTNLHSKSKKEFDFNESLAINFLQIIKRVKDNENLINFAQIYWPIIFIQAEPNYKLIIDNVSASDQTFKIINSPRTAHIGHILRNSNISYESKLDFIIKDIKFEEFHDPEITEENNKKKRTKFISKTIKGLFPNKINQAIGRLIPFYKRFNPNEVGCLERVYNFDESMEIAQKWLTSLKFVQGNIQRWKSLLNMIDEPLNKWLLDLNVKIKDQEEIYQKAIRNLNELDETIIQKQLNKQKDAVDSWIVQEQKAISERIGKMFKGIDLIFDDIKKKNKFFLNIDNLKTKPVGEVVMEAYKNIAHIRTAIEESDNQLSQISKKINQIRKELQNTNISAEEKIKLKDLELQNKKQEQDEKIRKLKEERDQKIGKLKSLQLRLENQFEEIKRLIQEKIDNCYSEQNFLRSFQVDDKITNINTPTLKIFIPIGFGLIEDEDFDERIEIVFPSEYSKELKRIPICEDIVGLEKQITKNLDVDMKLRSNFEFTADSAPEYHQFISSGLEQLFQQNLITNHEFEEAKSTLKKLS